MKWPNRKARDEAARRFYAAADEMALASASMPVLTQALTRVLDRLETQAAALASLYPPPEPPVAEDHDGPDPASDPAPPFER